jgi:hypothetical protein
MKNASVTVIFDGIQNTVFESQVLVPLKKKALGCPDTEFYLVSFERSIPDKPYANLPANIHLIFFKRSPFLGRISLVNAVRVLKKFIQSRKEIVIGLQARGPLAGYITIKARKNLNIPILIQVRGLLAAEYTYCHKNARWPQSLYHAVRARLYSSLEKCVFQTNQHNVIFQAVSTHLQDYLVKNFGTAKEKIEIACDDVPLALDTETKKEWRTEMRKKLDLEEAQTVYCYNGSAHSWQLPEAVIQFFSQQLAKNPESRLLILSRETEVFNKLAIAYQVPTDSIFTRSVDHELVYRYLAAADYGIIFREPHLLNWVSRPTKILEYRAAGLKIIHNNTIGMLCQSD